LKSLIKGYGGGKKVGIHYSRGIGYTSTAALVTTWRRTAHDNGTEGPREQQLQLRGLSPRATYIYISTERPPHIGEVTANFYVNRGCRVVSAADTCCRLLDFLDRVHLSRKIIMTAPPAVTFPLLLTVFLFLLVHTFQNRQPFYRSCFLITPFLSL
jgi:hypothetical protein